MLDLVNEVSKRIDDGASADSQTWLDVLTTRAGSWAVSDWNAMMAGEVIFPAKGAFGTCLQSRKADVRIFDLGFASPVRLIAGSTIGGLVQGSPAEKAGLRNGDDNSGHLPFYTQIDVGASREFERRLFVGRPY